ncbi:hypothetical protein ABEB36_014825 [Hypothenemus hampei]|uniref:Uncharacterized protein n=1 Tax=Hypothenemus hampei TaxID=57062 RepID=A0ABD1E0Z2_HYPHA
MRRTDEVTSVFDPSYPFIKHVTRHIVVLHICIYITGRREVKFGVFIVYIYVPSPLGAVRAVWLLLTGEFKLKSRGSSAVSELKEGFIKLSIFIERRKKGPNRDLSAGLQFFFLRRREAIFNLFFAPIVLWIQRAP